MLRNVLLSATMACMCAQAGQVWAQGPPHDDHDHYVRHDEWHKGGHIAPNDWRRAHPIDYHAYHLQPPPHGYEWRQVDGNYVLAAAATGLIATAIIASATH